MEYAIVTFFTNFIDILNDFIVVRWPDVAGHHILVAGKGPAVEIVYLLHGIQLKNFIIQFLGVDVRWWELHYNAQAVSENGHGGEEDEHREKVGANWVSDLPIWLEVYYDSCSNHTDTLHHVSENMNHGSPNVDVTLVFLLLFLFLFQIQLVFAQLFLMLLNQFFPQFTHLVPSGWGLWNDFFVLLVWAWEHIVQVLAQSISLAVNFLNAVKMLLGGHRRVLLNSL